jgi:hypothetical protein
MSFTEKLFVTQELDATNAYSKMLSDDFSLIQENLNQNNQEDIEGGLMHKTKEQKGSYFHVINGLIFSCLINNFHIDQKKVCY